MKKNIVQKAATSLQLSEFEADNEKLQKQLKDDSATQKEQLQKFPLEALPFHLQEILYEFSNAYRLPIEYFGLTALTVAAGIIGKSFIVRLKRGMYFPATIFSALVGHSSVGKSPVVKLCLKPLYDLEESFQKEYQEAVIEWEKECKSLVEKEPVPDKPTRKDLLVNNITGEALKQVLVNNPNGVLQVMDELLGWYRGLNQYRQGSDREEYMSYWSNAAVKNNRASQETSWIKNPCLSLLGGLTFSGLSIMGSGTNIDDGLIPRFLFAICNSAKKSHFSEDEPRQVFFENYKIFIHNLLTLRNTALEEMMFEEDRIVVNLEAFAKDAYVAYYNKITDVINSEESDRLRSMYSKLQEYCLRVALVLQLIELAFYVEEVDVQKIQVSESTMQNAILLTEYFRATSTQVLDFLEEVAPLERLTERQRKLYALLPSEFSTSQGIKKAEKVSISDRTFYRFLKRKELFRKNDHGRYIKLHS